jgi:TP901 family phage tail tape measure protein
MADFTVQGLVKLKDEFSDQLNKVSEKSASFFSRIKASAADMGQAVVKGFGVATDAFGILTGDYDKLGSLLSNIPGPLGEVGAVVGQVMGGILKDTVDAAEGFRRLNMSTGASVEFLSAFTQAADDVRVSSEVVSDGLDKFARGLGGLDVEAGMAGLKGVQKTVPELGIALTDSSGNMRSMEALLPEIAEAIKQIGPGAEASAIAFELFGRKGLELLPILLKGKDGLNDMMESARSAGLVMSTETVAAMERLKVAEDNLGDRVEAIKLGLGPLLVEALGKTIEKVDELAGKITGLAGSFQEALSGIQKALLDTGASNEDMAETGATVLDAVARRGCVSSTTTASRSSKRVPKWR